MGLRRDKVMGRAHLLLLLCPSHCRSILLDGSRRDTWRCSAPPGPPAPPQGSHPLQLQGFYGWGAEQGGGN